MSADAISQSSGEIHLAISRPARLSLPDTAANRKTMVVLARRMSHSDGSKTGNTYKVISAAFGHKDRQWSNNHCREFSACGGDILDFLKRENKLEESAFTLIEQQILAAPLLSPAEQYAAFQKAHPEIKLSKVTFRTYVGRIDARKLLKRIRELLSQGEIQGNSETYLKELLEALELTPSKRKEIVTLFPDAETDSTLPGPVFSIAGSGSAPETAPGPEMPVSQNSEAAAPEAETPPAGPAPMDSKIQKYLLVSVLYAAGLPYGMLSMLFGVCPSTIHNWIYALCTQDMENWMKRAITHWSGRISVDEKYIKISGVWYYVLSAVDAQTGFPLLICLHPSLDTVSWQVFFAKFKLLYGVPAEVVSDGSWSLLAGLRLVFPKVRHQLCKFHKLKNLTKTIFRHVKDRSLLTRCLRLAGNIFRNGSTSSRKAAARRLQILGGPSVAAYITTSIIGMWRKLTGSLTSNASERFNRKIQKCFFARYGIPTEQSAVVLLRALWLKEALLHGQKHIAATSPIHGVKMSKICQEQFQWEHIQHFLGGAGAAGRAVPA